MTKTYTDGYTSSKRTAHIVTVILFSVWGAGLIAAALYFRSQPENLFRAAVAFGAILAAVSVLALVPIIQRPVVAGRKVIAGNCDEC